jgi:hypothetical protein
VHQRWWQKPLTVLILAVLAGGGGAAALWSALDPFGAKTIDRTGAAVLQSLTDLSEFHAANGHYETVVDIEEDPDLLPGWVHGERILYVGKGDVDALVDFSELDERRVIVSADRTSVTVRLPAPTVDKPVLDLEGSYVVSHSKGIASKFGGSELERTAQLKAIEQMSATATEADMLTDQAKENTEGMLRGLLGALGFTAVEVSFDDDAAADHG